MSIHPEVLPDKAIPLTEEQTVLLKAADYIRTHGWRQDDYGTNDGPVCALGALGRVCGASIEMGDLINYNINGEHAFREAKTRLEAHLGIGEDFIPEWNDNDERTMEEVIDAMIKAALT